MKVVVVAVGDRPGRISPLVPDMVARLGELGCRVSVCDPDAGAVDLDRVRIEADLYVLKSGTEAALSLAGVLHRLGARLVNPYPVLASCRDKIVQTQALVAAGIPMPRSWLAADASMLCDELDDGPLIVKDPRGSRGRGIDVVRDAGQLRSLTRTGPFLVMRYQPPDGPDLKLYRIGGDVFGVERPFPARSYAEKVGRPFPVPDGLRETVIRCGEAFGISVYGVDVIRSGGREWVVDMSSFPGFKGVPDAGRRIADHLVAS